jgi:enoyl-CoA hydratase/carnithine racemase
MHADVGGSLGARRRRAPADRRRHEDDDERAKIRYEAAGGIAWITLHDPPANTYSYAMMRELDAAILDARMDARSTRSSCGARGEVLLRGRRHQDAHGGRSRRSSTYFCLHANETLSRLEQTPKVVIAALNGHCVGGGLEVALAADLRVAKRGAARSVSRGQPRRAPGTGGTQRLARVARTLAAFELMATGRTLSLEEAQAIGLVHEVFDAGDVRRRRRRVRRAVLPPSARRRPSASSSARSCPASKRVLRRARASSASSQQRLFESDDAREGSPPTSRSAAEVPGEVVAPRTIGSTRASA